MVLAGELVPAGTTLMTPVLMNQKSLELNVAYK